MQYLVPIKTTRKPQYDEPTSVPDFSETDALCDLPKIQDTQILIYDVEILVNPNWNDQNKVQKAPVRLTDY